jgi:Tol biopolymer transport system component
MQLKWYDRTGKGQGVAVDANSAPMYFPELSPDGQQVALTRLAQASVDVWLMDLAGVV